MSHSEVSTSQRNHHDFSGARSAPVGISVEVLTLTGEFLRCSVVASSTSMEPLGAIEQVCTRRVALALGAWHQWTSCHQP